MEKRFVSFLLAAALVMFAAHEIGRIFNPPKPPAAVEELADGDAGDVPVRPADDELADEAVAPDGPADAELGEPRVRGRVAAEVEELEATEPAPLQRLVLGSLEPGGPFQMAVYFTNRGAAIERIELNSSRYQDLDVERGYLGHLALSDDPRGGCRVGIVAPGSPAALAEPLSGTSEEGLRGPQFKTDEAGQTTVSTAGDRIIQLNASQVADADSFLTELAKTQPGQEVELTVLRSEAQLDDRELVFRAKLTKMPLSVIAPENASFADDSAQDQLSFLWTLGRVGNAKVGLGKNEIANLPSLWDENWQIASIPADGDQGPGVEFRRRLTLSELAVVGVETSLEMVKRYRLTAVDPQQETDSHGSGGYSIKLELEVRNVGPSDVEFAYQLDGPTGLPLEGWWYSYKVHPTAFSGAGARDVAWREQGGKHELFVCSRITKNAAGNEKNNFTPLAESSRPTQLGYVGCDAQYFSAVLLPDSSSDAGGQNTNDYRFSKAVARAVGPLDEERKKRTNVTFRITSQDLRLAPGETFREDFTVFAGPKQRDVLAHFGLDELIVYGWFGAVAKPMLSVLHFFHHIVRSWGLSIVLLTVLVRGCMFPLGRKMALNAQKMQELAPEMKRIAEKYKNDMEKRSQAQRELFAKHNYNPFAGCLVMFFQLPIFIGLYRSLSVDIALRQAPFLPGMSWCANLAGPDQFWHWEYIVPGFLSDPTGWLGPYLNILPVITVVLFLVQQQLFTPPAQDEQQKMQQQIMKFMMLFMGVLFHKIASGLCVYFIASSLWGIAERKLLPKSKASTAGSADQPTPALASTPSGGNGASATSSKRKRRKRKK